MNEAGEGPVQVEKKHPAVEAARGAIRKTLEANDSYQNWRKDLRVKDGKGFFRVYNTWDEARKHVVSVMTEADRNSLSTKLYELKMKIAGGAFFATDLALKVVSKAFMLGGTGLAIVSPFFPGAGLIGVAAGAGVAAGGWGTEQLRRYAEFQGNMRAREHVLLKSVRYKAREAGVTVAKAPELVGRIAKGILTDFAYPEGKPPVGKV